MARKPRRLLRSVPYGEAVLLASSGSHRVPRTDAEVDGENGRSGKRRQFSLVHDVTARRFSGSPKRIEMAARRERQGGTTSYRRSSEGSRSNDLGCSGRYLRATQGSHRACNRAAKAGRLGDRRTGRDQTEGQIASPQSSGVFGFLRVAIGPDSPPLFA